MIHIYPLNDFKDHDLETHLCECQPRLEEFEGTILVVHNSFDGRECVELANEILSADDDDKINWVALEK